MDKERVFMRNPYTPGPPVTQERFYGRIELIKEILSGQERQILIIGAPRMGKTSLLQHLNTTTSNINLYFSFETINSSKDFESLFEGACNRQSELDVKGVFNKAKSLRDILQALDENLQNIGIQMFLLLDEVHQLISLRFLFKKNKILKTLREFFDLKQICLVLAADQSICRLRQKSFLNNFQIKLLGPLEDDYAPRLIRQTQGCEVNVPDGTIAKIRDLTADQPWLIQTLCFELFNEEKNSLDTVSWTHFDRVYSDIIERPIMRDVYKSLSRPQKRIIRRISEMEIFEDNEDENVLLHNLSKVEKVKANEFESQIDNLNELRELGYIKGNTTSGYNISNAFLRRWLKENKNSDKKGIGKAINFLRKYLK